MGNAPVDITNALLHTNQERTSRSEAGHAPNTITALAAETPGGNTGSA